MQLENNAKPATQIPKPLGTGILPLVISNIRQLTPRIRAYGLRDPEGKDLPFIAAGAHLQVPVLLENQRIELRQYSIFSNPACRDSYDIAVMREKSGRGGSTAVHETYALGMQLNCELPSNNFQLHADSSPAILIAGGIGITAIKSMAQTLALRGRRFQLHYAGRKLSEMAFSNDLAGEFGNHFFAYPADENKRMNIMQLLSDAPHNALFYLCGPKKLMDDVYSSATLLGITKDRIQSEQFSLEKAAEDKAIVVELARSNKLIQVAADQPILSALRDAGIAVNFDCCVGDCSTCAVKIIAGEAEHRDHVLSDQERADGMICICVSRAKNDHIILDL
ncbi:MAG: PDR/VanB family oxidoreductase [Pseudomonadota bacterium]